MPSHAKRASKDPAYISLVCVVQYAHLVREIRGSPSMGAIFHLANYRHWRDNGRDQVLFAASQEHKDLIASVLCSMSCRLILQISHATHSDPNRGIAYVQSATDTELTTLLDMYQDRAGAQDCVLTAFDGIDVFSIAICLMDEHSRSLMPGRVESNRPLRTCLQILTTISNRFSATRSLLDVLWIFIDLLSGGDTAEISVFRLDQACHKLAVKLPDQAYDQMRAMLMQQANVHNADAWSRGRRETMPSI